MTIGSIAESLVQLAAAHERDGSDWSWQALRRFGESLHVIGGADLMTRAYDTAVERHGWNALPGVNQCWVGIEGWA
ncbi:hypothetical protein ACFSCW_03315 [Sphingomonas tabacisoli]|uniref:Uncharacterized protein n=1 Tax=Sphingomonas tabacisoli TaxID=2249466 RepID=A0ABW4HZV5_9SPHN